MKVMSNYLDIVKLNPMVYCGLYPVDNSKYKNLREALEKIQLK